MEPLSRRAFIGRSSALAAAAGIAAIAPAQIAGAATQSRSLLREPAVGGLGAEGEAGAPVIAYIRNLASGEISIFAGDREITLYDRTLASRLVRATGGK